MSAGCGAQVQLRGPQDSHTLAIDEGTFWRIEYTRHTNAAVGELIGSFNSSVSYGAPRVSATLDKLGDIISTIYLRTNLAPIAYNVGAVNPYVAATDYAAYVDSFPHALIDQVACRIGNVELDRQSGLYMELAESLMAPSNKLMSEQNFHFATDAMRGVASTFNQDLWTPLRFWFCRFYEQGIPLQALYWNEITIEFAFRRLTDLVQYYGAMTAADVTVPTTLNVSLVYNAVFLDNPERQNFAENKHEFVYDYVQFIGTTSVTNQMTNVRVPIRFNNSVNEIIFVCQQEAAETARNWFNFDGPNETGTGGDVRAGDPFATARIMLNNSIRVDPQPPIFYRVIQPQQYHSRIPDVTNRRVYCYSFAIRPEELLDTGSVNMSRMDDAAIEMTIDAARKWTGKVYVYARAKNYYSIEQGVASRLYA